MCLCLWQAGGVYSHGEDQAGAAGQLYLVWQEEEAVQRQVFGKAQCRYTTLAHMITCMCTELHAADTSWPECMHVCILHNVYMSVSVWACEHVCLSVCLYRWNLCVTGSCSFHLQ